jgi:hypothetical protein
MNPDDSEKGRRQADPFFLFFLLLSPNTAALV